MQNKLVKAGNFLKQNKTPILYVGGAIAVLVVTIPLIKRLRRLAKGKSSSSATFYDINAKELDADVNKATITVLQAKQLANQLVKYMSVSYGTNLSGIRDVFEQIENEDDMKLLYREFGVRKYSTINTGEASGVLFGVIETLFGFRDLDLVGWLDTELDFLDIRTKNAVNEKLQFINFKIN